MMQMLKALYPTLIIIVTGLIVSFYSPVFSLLIYVFGLLDFNGRLTDYRYLSQFKYMNARIISVYGRSYCGRQVVVTLFPIYGNFYRVQGYRRWHLLPDGFPKVLFRKDFWLSLAFGHSRGVKA